MAVTNGTTTHHTTKLSPLETRPYSIDLIRQRGCLSQKEMDAGSTISPEKPESAEAAAIVYFLVAGASTSHATTEPSNDVTSTG